MTTSTDTPFVPSAHLGSAPTPPQADPDATTALEPIAPSATLAAAQADDTRPLPPPPSGVELAEGAVPPPPAPGAETAQEVPPSTPFLRRTWVRVAGAVLAVVLLFGSGFATGYAVSSARLPLGGAGTSDVQPGGAGGPGGGPGGDQGGLPGQNGQQNQGQGEDSGDTGSGT
ncbi:hypothetical protein [Miniimonas sp. S16]|uniref:hypothetical protein n=1 Tax=Miniimonas sp. S16 TaxID=2171623 RepID=UPI000D52980D|nr:hypothetical protein [Miniimonas sp. S16]